MQFCNRDVLELIIDKVHIKYLSNLLLVNNFSNNITKKYSEQIKKYNINKNYCCLICEKRVIRDAIIINCNCMNNHSVIHIKCQKEKQTTSCQRGNCPFCQKTVSYLLTNKK